ESWAEFRVRRFHFIMSVQTRNWSLARIKGGLSAEMIPLFEGANTIGRDESNRIVLGDSSVSRHHAEIACGSAGVSVRDLGSLNGVRVNGVPRQQATLQAGDQLEIGDHLFELRPSEARDTTLQLLGHVLQSAAEQKQTIDGPIRLPQQLRDRYLATLYHVCFWIAEGVEENAFVPRCLRLLVEALRAQEAHLYSANRQLEASATEARAKPGVELKDFLAKKFQDSTEATVILGKDIRQRQQRVDHYNYLVGPLRISQSNS